MLDLRHNCLSPCAMHYPNPGTVFYNNVKFEYLETPSTNILEARYGNNATKYNALLMYIDDGGYWRLFVPFLYAGAIQQVTFGVMLVYSVHSLAKHLKSIKRFDFL